MLKIRLSRGGSCHDPHFCIVVIESSKRRDGKFVEKVGHYHPKKSETDPNRVVISEERCAYWIGNGAMPTDAVLRIMKSKSMNLPARFNKEVVKSKYHGMARKDVKAALKKETDDMAAAIKANAERKKKAKIEAEAKKAASESK